MAKSFLSINSSYNDFSTVPSRAIDSFLLKNCEINLSKIYGFCQKPEDILVLSGFLGTGKTQIVKHLLNYLDKDVCSFKIYCSSSMSLDDLLLSLWSQFISDTSNMDIAYKYREAASFQDKVSGYFTDFRSNIIITLFDFDLITDDNKAEVINFLTTVSSSDKIKVIIVSKTFDTSVFNENVKCTKVILKALSRTIFENYMSDKGVNATSRIFDELYKITRGYYLYVAITTRILVQKKLSVNDYLAAYTNSGLPFDKFLAKAYVSMLPENCLKLLQLLSLIRHPINSQVLDYLECYDEQTIDFLCENLFLFSSDKLFIFNNYFRNEILDGIPKEEEQSIHQKLAAFYNSQLPLKPSERLLLLSRITMRTEAGYHLKSVSVHLNEDCAEEIKDQTNLPKADLFKLAQELTSNYQYKDAIQIYLRMLDDKSTNKWEIYDYLAKLYDKQGNYKYALHYMERIVEHYSDSHDVNLENKYKLDIAQIYYRAYKTTEAINLLYEIISQSTSTEITIEAYTLLGNIYIALSSKNKAYELYSKAIILSERDGNKINLPELYFKFALLADEKDEVDIAINYYKRCIEISEDSDKYKSLSYSNLGDFYLDIEDKQSALNNFRLAYALDEKNLNNFGIYYTSSNIAKLIVNTSQTEGYRYLIIAKAAATKTNDIYAMANAGLHLGDYYANINQTENALREYFLVFNLVKDRFSEENKKRILVRINDIKLKIGEERFNELNNKE